MALNKNHVSATSAFLRVLAGVHDENDFHARNIISAAPVVPEMKVGLLLLVDVYCQLRIVKELLYRNT